MKKMKLVVVGNGMAGIRAVEELLRLALPFTHNYQPLPSVHSA